MIVTALGVFDLTPSVHENDAESDTAEHLKSLNNETGDSQTVAHVNVTMRKPSQMVLTDKCLHGTPASKKFILRLGSFLRDF